MPKFSPFTPTADSAVASMSHMRSTFLCSRGSGFPAARMVADAAAGYYGSIPLDTKSWMADAPRRVRRVLQRLIRDLPASISAMLSHSNGSQADESASAIKLTPKQEKAWRDVVRLKRYFVIVLDNKGGIGKSVTVQVSNETLKASEPGDERPVLVIDADFINKNLSRIGLSNAADALRAEKTDFEGHLFDASEQLIENIVKGVVADSAAGGEAFFNRHLPSLARELKDGGARLIVIRPITTNPLNQDNCVDFGRHVMTDDMGVVMVRNFGQGREEEDFKVWMESTERREMLAAGMVECDLESAGALCSDLAAAVEVTIADIAVKKISDMNLSGRKRAIADTHFTRPFRLFVGRWMTRQTMTFEKAFAEAVRRTFR